MFVTRLAKHKVYKKNIAIKIEVGPWLHLCKTTIWVRLRIILRSGVGRNITSNVGRHATGVVPLSIRARLESLLKHSIP